MRYPISVMTLLLGGCGLVMQQQAMQQMQADGQACQLHRNGGQPPQTAYTNCIADAYERAARRGAPRDLDLVRAINSQRLVLAEKYDDARISRAEFEAGMAELDLALSNTSSQRDAAQQAASAAMMAQGAAVMAGSSPPAPTASLQCPSGTYDWTDSWGNKICRRFGDNSTVAVQGSLQSCPVGTHPWTDEWGNRVCQAFGNQRRLYDTSKGCPVGSSPGSDAWGKPTCKW